MPSLEKYKINRDRFSPKHHASTVTKHIALNLCTCLLASEVFTPLLLTLGRAAEEGADTEKHLYGKLSHDISFPTRIQPHPLQLHTYTRGL